LQRKKPSCGGEYALAEHLSDLREEISTPVEDIDPPSEAENAPKEQNLPQSERSGADAKGKYASQEGFFPLLLPKLLYPQAMVDERVDKIGLNVAVDDASKGDRRKVEPRSSDRQGPSPADSR
jgi:hypothetical protein